MADCWSCGAERGDASFCTTCHTIQPVSDRVHLFDTLGLPKKMAQDREVVEKAFREASRNVHPDRFGQASSIERKLALGHTEKVNEAYRTLKDPQRRAEYLLGLEGVKVGAETARTKDPEFLMEMMALQEKVDETEDPDDLEEFEASIEKRWDGLIHTITAYFDHQDGTQSQVAQALDELRYLKRLRERIDIRLEEMV